MAKTSAPPSRVKKPEIRQAVQQRAQITSASWSGPLPHPSDLNGFNQVIPGGAERILKMAEDQQAHRQLIEMKAIEIESSVAAGNTAAQREEAIAIKRGHLLGATVSALSVAASVGSVAIGAHWSVSVALVGVPLMSAVRAIILRK